MNGSVDARARSGSATLQLAVLIAFAGLASVAANVLGGTSITFALVPVLLLGGLYVVVKVPLRWSATCLLALVLTLDQSSDAHGVWHTPLAPLGDLLFGNLPGVPLSGFEVTLLFLLGLSARRRFTSSSLDTGRISSVPATRYIVLLYVAGLLYAEVNGLARGGDAALWKLRNNLQVLPAFMLFEIAFRGPSDHRLIGRVVVVAAILKSLLALWIQWHVAPAATGGELTYVTNHGDSILFAVAAALLVTQVMERADARSIRTAALLLPVVLLGMVANGRRTAWVILALGLLTSYILSAWTPIKVKVTRAILVLSPILALYAAVGWSSSSGVFAPVKLLRSVVDPSSDNSTRWREIENWNICMSIRESPLLGIGLGKEYTEFMRNGNVAVWYPEYRAWPHNSILGLLLLAGVVGFTALWSAFAYVVFLAVRSYRFARAADDRVAALGCVFSVIACITIAYGDLGANFMQYRVFSAVALAVAAKLATATGSWTSRPASDVPRRDAMARLAP